jgi:hypothetical protein
LGHTEVSEGAARDIETLRSELDVIGTDAILPKPQWLSDAEGADWATGTTAVLVWEAWCPHSRQQLERLAKTDGEFQGSGIQLLGLTQITRWATEESVAQAASDAGATFPMAQMKPALAHQLLAERVPAAAVIHDGRIIWRGPAQALQPSLVHTLLKSST